MGAPGAGKGTQASILSKEFSVPKIATGDMLRLEADDGTELGKGAEEYMRKGLLVPDGMIIEMVRRRLAREDCGEGFILDGFPRNLKQARALEGMGSVDLVIYLEVGEEDAIERFADRRACSECQAVYHLRFSPPRSSDKCDLCGGELYQREDDREEVVLRRFRTYREMTKPLVDFYRDRSVLEVVRGSGSIEEVSQAIRDTLHSRGIV